MKRSLLFLVVVTTAWIGTLAGTGLLQVLVHLPARHRLGADAYAAYLRATAFSRGLVLFPLLGIGGAVLVCATFIVALRSREVGAAKVLLGVAAASHLLGLATARAGARIAQQLRITERAALPLMPVLDRFARAQTMRVVFIEATFCCLLATLASLAYLGRLPARPAGEGSAS